MPDWDLDRVREGLIAGTSGVDFRVNALAVRVSDSPLFQSGRDGEMRQAMRLRLQSEADLGEVTFTALDGDAVLDRVTAAVAPGGCSLHLLVPEVRQPRAVRLRVAPGAGEPFEAAVEVKPQRKCTVFFIHHSHLDIGYTDPQALVLQHQLAYLDSALDLVSATDGWPDPARFRWNV